MVEAMCARFFRLPESHKAWPGAEFNSALKRELEALPLGQLPLQQCLKVGSHVLDDKPSVMILSVTDSGEVIRTKIGVLFKGIIAGCSCADDPTPVEAVNEYCEMYLELDKSSGKAAFTAVEDGA